MLGRPTQRETSYICYYQHPMFTYNPTILRALDTRPRTGNVSRNGVSKGPPAPETFTRNMTHLYWISLRSITDGRGWT